jgi:hypothetical protein
LAAIGQTSAISVKLSFQILTPRRLAGGDHRGVAENSDRVALPAGFGTQDTEPALSIVEVDALDETGQTSVGVLVLGVCSMDMMTIDA